MTSYLKLKLREELAKSSKNSSFSSLFLVIMFLIALNLVIKVNSLILCSSIFLFLVLIARNIQARNVKTDSLNWLNQYSVILFFHSLGWFSLIVTTVYSNLNNSSIVLLCYTVVAGLIAGGAYTVSISKRDFIIYQLGLIAAVIAGFWLMPVAFSFSLISTCIVMLYLVFLLKQQKIKEQAWLELVSKNFELQKIIDTVPAGISVLKNGIYVKLNKHLESYLSNKLGIHQLVGKNIGDFFGENDAFVSKLKLFINSDKSSIQFESDFPIGHDRNTHLVTAQNFFKPGETETIIATINISDLKKAEFENRNNQIKLEHSSKMASLGEMSSGLAHEINNPLAVILGRVELLMKNVDSNKMDKAYLVKGLETIEKTSVRIQKIVKGLQSFARDAVNDPFVIKSVYELIDETISFCENRFKVHGIDLQLNYKFQDDISIFCQPIQISQVLLNALNNAHDAVELLENKWIRIEIIKSENYCQIVVTDSGSGIPKNLQAKLMQPFFTTKEVGKGTGLGLSLSKGIIEQHKGEFFFNFEHPSNTQLIIKLPINLPNESPAQLSDETTKQLNSDLFKKMNVS